MQKELIHSLIYNFESHANKTNDGTDFWLARDLQKLLGYSKWDNFKNAISKAKESCKNAGFSVAEEFLAAPLKTLDLGGRPARDYILSRYACYLIAQNGDSKKEEIAFAQRYFAL